MSVVQTIILCGTLAVVSASATTDAAALRIMPLGDSITEWQCGVLDNASTGDVASFGGYRGKLFGNLQRQWGPLYAYESVGGQHGCGSHEGHSGWTCEMLADIITDSATAYRPDVVMLMCGTNDLWYRNITKNPEQGGTPEQVLDRINTLLERLYAVVPEATVLLSTVSNINATKCLTYPQGACPPSMPADIISVNTALPSKVVAPHNAKGRKIFLHDVNADAQWVEKDFWTWGIHRSEAGFAKMAASWGKTLVAHVSPPSRACKTAFNFLCGTHAKDSTECSACLRMPFAKKTLTRANCTFAEVNAFCPDSV